MRTEKGLLLALIFCCIACDGAPHGAIVRRTRDGRPNQWIYRIDRDTYKMAFDTNGDGRPDVIKTYRRNVLVKIENDRNYDGRIDQVEIYSGGTLSREVCDDDFDGKPEAIKLFRAGKLTMIERDPKERGYVDIVEYYDEAGRLIRREFRTPHIEG